MDDSYVNGLTSSIPITSQSLAKFGENNENDEIGSHISQKSDKVVMKHFMSPAIPAATKATLFPRKKILAERNEAFTFTDPPKSPILDSRTCPIVSARSVRSNCSSDCESDDDGLNDFDFDFDSSTNKPYDPVTNYLSPRPQYLRYNPNRKHRIFVHGESDTAERNDGLDVVCISSSSESQKEVVEEETYEQGSVKKEDDESEKTEGSCSDNDEEEDAEEEEIEEFEDDDEEEEVEKCWSLLGLFKLLLVLGSLYISTSYIYSMNSPDHSLIEEANWDFIDGVVSQGNEHEVDTRKEYFASETETLVGKGEESHISLLNVTQKDMDSEFVDVWSSEVYEDDKGLLASTVESEEVDEVQNEKSEDAYNDGSTSKVETSDASQWEETKEIEANLDVEVARYIEAEASTGSYIRANVQEDLDQLQGNETAEVTESFRDDLSIETEASAYLNAEDEQMESTEEIKLQLEIVALVVLLTIVAALGLLYYVNQRNSNEDFLSTQVIIGEEDSLPIETHQLNDELVEKASQTQNNNVISNLEVELGQKVESFSSPSTPMPSTKVDSEDFSRQSQAPIVELLGELVIGEDTSSSFRSRRTRMLESEEKNASNSLSTQMMISRSKTSLVPSQLHPSQLDHSTADSSSRKKKSSAKKEEGRSREVSTPTMTPVRRSSRIRNKAMSP